MEQAHADLVVPIGEDISADRQLVADDALDGESSPVDVREHAVDDDTMPSFIR
jgi:hypothetical protein